MKSDHRYFSPSPSLTRPSEECTNRLKVTYAFRLSSIWEYFSKKCFILRNYSQINVSGMSDAFAGLNATEMGGDFGAIAHKEGSDCSCIALTGFERYSPDSNRKEE